MELFVIVTYTRFVEFIILLSCQEALTMTRYISQRCLEMSDIQENKNNFSKINAYGIFSITYLFTFSFKEA